MPSESILTGKHILLPITGSNAPGLARMIAMVELVLLVVGCVQVPLPTQTATERIATPNPAPRMPVSPTVTAALRPSVTPESAIDVPAWLIDPEANVMMAKTVRYDEQHPPAEYGVALFDASTGERYDLPLKDIAAYFWMLDGKQIGLLLDSDDRGLYLIDNASGKITRVPLTANMIKHAIYGLDPMPLVPSDADITAPDFFLFNPSSRYYFLYALSADRHYKADYEQLEGDKSITVVENLLTGKLVQVPQAEGLYDRLPTWSPVDDLLAVVQSTEPWSLGAPPGELTTRIFDASTATVIASYPGAFSIWSPDGRRFLYGDEQPCIFEWENERSWCLDDGRSLHGGEQVRDYAWSPDGSTVSYIYFSYPSVGGLCIKSLAGGNLRCPTMDIPELANRYVRRYGWSPDGQYLIFLSDSDSCPDCDYSNDPQIGMIDVYTGAYWYPLGDFDYDTSDLAVWRPAIASQ